MADQPAVIEAIAPLRISFVGGGTDFPHWFDEHGGAVLSTTIDHVVRARVTARDDRVVELRSLDLDQLVAYHLDDGPVYDGALDLVKAAIVDAGLDSGVTVEIRSEAPPGSGLGGSSAVVLGGAFGGKAGLVALVSKELADRGLSAGSIIREIAPIVGGGGGGRDDMAQAGGKDPAKLDEALAAARTAVERELD